MAISNAEAQRNFQRRVRIEAIIHYGGRCACCGEDEIKFLTIEHPNGGGHQERKKNGYSQMGYWLKKNGWPKGYEVLCYNCNCAKGNYGVCPHKDL